MPSNLTEFVLGGMAGSTACLFTNPLEVVKTRMQLQGELKARGSYAVHYRNAFHASYTIARHEGILALQKGLAPGICYQVIMNGARLGSYQIFTNTGLTLGQDGKPVFLKCVVAGAVSGALGAFFGSPAYMMKTQLQSQSVQQIAVGHQHAHKGFIIPLRDIYNKYGTVGLWRGVSSAIARVMAGSAAQLSTFSKVKEHIESTHVFPDKSWLIPACSSMISSVAVVMCMTPFDVVATRLYNQGTDRSGKGLVYRGFLDCFWKVFKKEGLLGFYKGVGPHYFRIGPHTVLSLLFWDELRKAHEYYFGDNS